MQDDKVCIMRKKTFFLLYALLFAVCSRAQELSERPELDLLTMQKQINAKRIYREAYEQDNDVKFSALEKLEYVIANNPGLDDDTMAVVKRGTALMKKMNFGMYQDDMQQAGMAFEHNPTGALKVISNLTKTDATERDALAVTDIMGASERMKEKMLKGDPLGTKSYQININDF